MKNYYHFYKRFHSKFSSHTKPIHILLSTFTMPENPLETFSIINLKKKQKLLFSKNVLLKYI